jgi:RNA polymerase-binding transcription factor DksA
MITAAKADEYRHRLLGLLRRLDRDRSQLEDEVLCTGVEAGGGLSDVPAHLADASSHGVEEDLTLGLLANEEQMIEELNAGLERIDEGVFGRCEACRREIPEHRLRVLPYARYCVACARRLAGKPHREPSGRGLLPGLRGAAWLRLHSSGRPVQA